MAQNLARDEAGNVWEVDAQGNPVRLVSHGQQGQPNVVMPSAPPEPKFVPEHPNLIMSNGPGGPSVTEVPGIPAPKPPAPNFVPGMPGVTVGPDGKPATLPGAPNPNLDASVRQKAIQGFQFSELLKRTVADLRQKFAAGPGKTSGVQGGKDYLPFTVNKEFDSAADAARGIIGQTLQFTGGQLNTEHESEMNLGPYLPHSGDRDDVIKDKLNRLDALADTGHAMSVQTLGGVPDPQGNIHPVPPPSQQITPPPPPDVELNAGKKTRTQIDPVLQAVGNHVGSMIATGASDSKIHEYLVQNGVNPAETNITQILRDRRNPDSIASKWLKDPRNTGKSYPIGPAFYTKQIGMTPARQMLNAGASTDIGGALATAPISAANAITGDRLASLSGDPMAKTGMDLLREQHPISSLVGDVAGQATIEALAGRIPGAQNLLLSRYGRRAGDALYGAYQGSGDSSNGDPLTGALYGGGSNLAGGMFGRGLQKGVGRTLSGVKNASLQYLDNLGVPLTIGQMGHGSENTVGHFIGGLEDRLAGLPGTDAVIDTARHRGAVGFNQAAFREAGGSGASGAAGLSEINGLKNGAYGFLNGTDIPLDAQFAGRNAAVRASIPGMPEFGPQVDKSLNLLDNVSSPGSITGSDWQSAISDLRGNRSSISGKPFFKQAGRGMKEVENNLLELADRQGPAGTVDNLNVANRLNAQAETLASALDNGPTQKAGQLFTPGRLDDVSRVNTRNFGGRMASLTGKNRPFYDLTQAGMEVLPNVVKDSGTAGRMMLVPLLTSSLGTGIGAATNGDDRLGGSEEGLKWGALAGALAMGPYSKVGQKIIQKALLGDRPSKVVKIGDYLVNNPRLSGMFGANGLRDYLTY